MAVIRHVLIVGAGFSGLYAARALRRAPVRITVVDRRNHHLFQPLLYQVGTAALSPGDIAMPLRALLGRQKNTRVLLAEVVSVDPATRTVELREGDTLCYDYLILATGAEYNYFGHDEWARYAPALKTLDDALDVRRRILLAFEKAERELDEERRRSLLTFVLVGGGPTGVEMAGAIAEISRKVMVEDFRTIDPRQARILLLEAGPRVLPSFPEHLSEKAQRQLEKLGAEVWTNTAVKDIGPEYVITGDRRIAAATIIWAAGVRALPLTKTLGVPLDRIGRVLVNPDLTIPGHTDVFVIGDHAAFLHEDGQPLPGVAPVAIQMGRHAAKGIVRRLRGLPLEPFRYRDKGNLATIGRAAAVADFGWITFSGFAAWLLWLIVHIFWLIGFRNRFVVMFEWAWAYFTFQRAARLITGPMEDQQS